MRRWCFGSRDRQRDRGGFAGNPASWQPGRPRCAARRAGAIAGFRPGRAGEFTRRAFLNGKLDLTAAEGLADLIDATSRAQARQAFRQLDGELGRLYGGWRERVLAALALLEAEIDFAADEEVPDAMLARVLPDLTRLAGELAAHLADGGRGERLRAGVTVAVIGPPNVGKSSLVNRWSVGRSPSSRQPRNDARRDRGSARPGGLPVTMLDTAGLRDTADPVEAEGVARARSRAGQADLRLYVFEAGIRAEMEVEAAICRRQQGSTSCGPVWPGGSLVRTGEGVPALVTRLTRSGPDLDQDGAAPLLTRARHR